ncbi:hypothetical protein B0T10DRAFT_466176 [Thelonectria olida]|uniref:Uncharacterized protein n=1 Tax=Thelonectria olida TaxID=1576542 RepID=A0A9P9AKY7_9HYPO|nr:hypothetical protein B0T10DRAFT_466176 [Thelonectria olida]
MLSVFPVASLGFYTLSLTGCVSNSPGLPNVFLVAMNSSSVAELRVGYFGNALTAPIRRLYTGVCLHRNGSQTCVATPYSVSPQSLKSTLSVRLSQNDINSELSTAIFSTALQLQRSICFCLQTFAGVLFISSLLLFLTRIYIHMSKWKRQQWRLIEQKWPEKVLISSVAISLINAASITQTGNALQFATGKLGNTSLSIRAGYTLQVLEWLGFAFSATFYAVVTKRSTRQSGNGLSSSEKLDSFPPAPPPRPPPPGGKVPRLRLRLRLRLHLQLHLDDPAPYVTAHDSQQSRVKLPSQISKPITIRTSGNTLDHFVNQSEPPDKITSIISRILSNIKTIGRDEYDALPYIASDKPFVGEDMAWGCGSDSNVNPLTFLDADAAKGIQNSKETFSYSNCLMRGKNRKKGKICCGCANMDLSYGYSDTYSHV